MMAGHEMFQTTSAATSAGVPRATNLKDCWNKNRRATPSSSSGITNEKIMRRLRLFEVRLRQRSMPIANPTPSGTVMIVTRNASHRVWMTAACRFAACRTDGVFVDAEMYHSSEKPWKTLWDLPWLNENKTARVMGRIDHAR